MSDTTRRKLLGSLGVVAGAALAGSAVPAEAQTTTLTVSAAANPSLSMKGLLHGLGGDGRLFPGWEDSRQNEASVVTTLDLADGSVRQTPLSLPGGHAAMAMGDGRILCLGQHKNKCIVLDPAHKVIAEIVAPSTLLFGGHGLVCTDRDVFVVALRAAHQKKLSDQGTFQVYDLKTLKLLDQVKSGGLQPHEIHVIPNTGELAVTHYGDIHVPRRPFENNIVESKLTILDAQTFKPKRHYPQPEFNAMVTHMRVDKDGWAYFVLSQQILWLEPEEVDRDKDPFTVAARELEKAMGRKRTFALPYKGTDERDFPLPLPFVRVNTQTGERQIIDAGDQNHLRSQSVAYSEFTGKAIGLYYYSDTLIVHKPGEEPEIITGSELQLADIRGITEIPGTPLIAVMGSYRGISIMDLNNRKVIYHDAVVGV
jgi:hypothetical protein